MNLWEIDKYCDAFEVQLQSGSDISIEKFLAEKGLSRNKDLLLELMKLEIDYGRTRPSDSTATYSGRFPEAMDDFALEVTQSSWDSTLGYLQGAQNFEASALPSVLSDETPAAIGRYQVLSKLGQGGQSVVYLGLHPQLHCRVAIKLGRKVPVDPERRQWLLQEGRLLASLQHPGVVRVLDLDFDQGRPFLVMDYIEGKTLAQHIQAAPLPPVSSVEVVAKVADAVAALHQAAIVHQDLKPANILMRSDGQPLLIDFGLARRHQIWSTTESERTSIDGTVAYMPPEQARGDHSRIAAPTDVFALGAVLYRLLTGDPPFRAGTLEAALDRAARCDFASDALHRPDIPPSVRQVCLKALSAAPEDRYASAAELAAALRRSVGSPRATRRTALASLAAIALLAAVASLGGAWWWPQPPGDVPGLIAPSMEVSVLREGVMYPLREAVPLRTSDRLRLVGRAFADSTVRLYWFDSEGHCHELPLQQRGQGVRQEVVYPPYDSRSGEETWVELDGEPGTEILVLCAGRRSPPASDRLPFSKSRLPWPELPEDAVVEIQDGQVSLKGVRGPGGVYVPKATELEQRVRQLVQELERHFDSVYGIGFSHRAP